MEDFTMMKLRRLTKTIKRYMHFFQYEQEEFRDNIDFYIEDTKKQIFYTNSYISSTQNKLDKLYKVNVHLYSINPTFVLKPFVFIVQKLLEKIIDIKSNNALIAKRYKKYFEKFLDYLERMKYLCDL